MAFCITFGTHEFTNQLEGYEGVTAQCHNCGNWSAHCITRWPWFTVCFLPVVPLATHKYKEVACPICHFMQDLSNRPDVQSQHPGAGAMMVGGGGPPPPGIPPGHGPPAGYGPPPGQGGMQYK
ncbi:hypothetical protein ABVK25_005351 [Lepraria finkii]|uniref:Rhodopsin family protein n=1 Tax=Lepraria finkii TaxID=1340010 RepID=A0ABR4B9D6_9LECA